MMTNMNANPNNDVSNLNVSSSNKLLANGGGEGASAARGGSTSPGEKLTAPASSQSSKSSNQQNMSNMEYLKNLADAISGQDANRNSSSQYSNHAFMPTASSGVNDYQRGPSSSSNAGSGSNGNGNNAVANNNSSTDAYVQLQGNGGSDTDTCASSYAARRISKDSLVSRDSLSDMLSADQVASDNLAMMNMLANQQQQQMGGGNNQNASFNLSNSFAAGQQHQALNQSMSQLMMNGSMNSMGNGMSQMGQFNMMNNVIGSWNNSGSTNLFGGSLGSQAPLVIPPKKTKNKHKQTFAQKLMHILSIKECQMAIRWMPNGCAFCIVDSKQLVDKVLPKYFKEAKYTSFTRKLNRWGFKHFTLPTSEPSNEKEMSIYTHEKFLRDNPGLCQQMDGGHRRRNSLKDAQQDSSQVQGSSGIGQADAQVQQLQQHQSMMMQQMQQLKQQNMMMQQMQQHVMNQQNQMSCQNQAGQNQMFDMSVLNNMGGSGGVGGGTGTTFNSIMGSSFNTNNSNFAGNQSNGGAVNLMESNGAIMGMRRTSLGFMPYLPTSNRTTNRRDSGFSVGALSTVSNDLANSFTEGMAGASNGSGQGSAQQLGGSALSLEKFRKMSPGPGGVMGNATFDDFKAATQGAGNGGGANNSNNKGGIDAAAVNLEDIRHSQAKLAVLEDMIAKERRKQSLLSSLDNSQVEM